MQTEIATTMPLDITKFSRVGILNLKLAFQHEANSNPDTAFAMQCHHSVRALQTRYDELLK